MQLEPHPGPDDHHDDPNADVIPPGWDEQLHPDGVARLIAALAGERAESGVTAPTDPSEARRVRSGGGGRRAR